MQMLWLKLKDDSVYRPNILKEQPSGVFKALHMLSRNYVIYCNIEQKIIPIARSHVHEED